MLTVQLTHSLSFLYTLCNEVAGNIRITVSMCTALFQYFYCWGHGIGTCGCRRYGTIVLFGTWDGYFQMQMTCGCRRYCTVWDVGWVLPNVGGMTLLYCWGHEISTCGRRRYCTVGDSTCGCRRHSTVVLLGTWDQCLWMWEVQHCCTVGDMGLVLVDVGGSALLQGWCTAHQQHCRSQQRGSFVDLPCASAQRYSRQHC